MGFGLSIWRSFDGIYFRLSNTYIVPKWNHPFEDTSKEHISDFQTHLYCSQIMGLSIWGYFDGTYFRLSNTYYISCFKFYIVGLSTKKTTLSTCWPFSLTFPHHLGPRCQAALPLKRWPEFLSHRWGPRESESLETVLTRHVERHRDRGTGNWKSWENYGYL